MERYVAVQIVN